MSAEQSESAVDRPVKAGAWCRLLVRKIKCWPLVEGDAVSLTHPLEQGGQPLASRSNPTWGLILLSSKEIFTGLRVVLKKDDSNEDKKEEEEESKAGGRGEEAQQWLYARALQSLKDWLLGSLQNQWAHP